MNGVLRRMPWMGNRMASVWPVEISNKQPAIRQSFRSFSTTATTGSKEQSKPGNTTPSIQLYQYAICPFCNIVKTVLDYAELPYQAIEVNPLTKKELKWSTDYRKVPIVVMDEDKPIFGSDQIVQELLLRSDVQEVILKKQNQEEEMWKEEFSRLLVSSSSPQPPADATNNNDSSTAKIDWIDFARNELAVLLYPNICATWKDSFQSFSYVHTVPTFSSMEKHSIQWLGSMAMYMAASKIKRKRNLDNIRLALEEQLLVLEVQGLMSTNEDTKNQRDKLFLSGTAQPNMSDLTVFGTLRAIEGFPIHTELVLAGGETKNDKSTITPLAAWYSRMKEHV